MYSIHIGEGGYFFWPRAVIATIEGELKQKTDSFRDRTYQAIVVFCKIHSRESKEDPEHGKTKMNSEIIREEISNRYSYYYARIENAITAPSVGYLLSYFFHKLFWSTGFLHDASFSPVWIAAGAMTLAIALLWHVPQLFKELDDLEVCLVTHQADCWPEMGATTMRSSSLP